MHASARNVHATRCYVHRANAAADKLRDALAVRAQLASLPMGDQQRYQSVLEHAYGGRIDDEENSRLMQSYRKTIWEQFEEAFPSNP